MTDQPEPHSCSNCEGVDPDTCFANPARHVCQLYFCPTSGEVESACHGGFGTCCDRPDLHRRPTTAEILGHADDGEWHDVSDGLVKPAPLTGLASIDLNANVDWHPTVQGRCPACRGESLFLGSGGYVTCARLDCPDPEAATRLLEECEPTASSPEWDAYPMGVLRCLPAPATDVPAALRGPGWKPQG